MFKQILQLPFKAWPWLSLSAIAAVLFTAALYFQYVVGLAPCMMCIYQRVAIASIFLSGLVGALGRRHSTVRWLATLIWLVSSLWGLKIAYNQVNEERIVASGGFSSCGIFPDFPAWMPLHEWLPAAFNPTGMCGEVAWTLFSYSMAFWMQVTFAMFIAASLVVAAIQIKIRKA